MKTFLEEIAIYVHKNFQKPEEVTIVFPNRRAILYFRKYFGDLLSKPVFSPTLLTVEEFVSGFSTAQVPDKLELISRLYHCYFDILRKNASSSEAEPFDKFYFWGEMLLRDFDEADRYLVTADHLFKDLSHQKELDTSFDYLTEEQKEFLNSFWSGFDENVSVNKKRFLDVWKKLPEVYKHFKDQLSKAGLAYEGMLQREVAETIADRNEKLQQYGSIIFAGFNALTKAEEIILSHCVENANAKIFWDFDAYYVNNKSQEAGKFFREYQEHNVLRKTFDPDVPSHFHSRQSKSAIKLFGAAQPVGQAKLLAQVLHEHLQTHKAEETLVVLPDEKLLIPVLHGISGLSDALNVTMGFPLSSTPLFNLIELIVDLQLGCKNAHFNHRQVLAILGHPYVIAADPVSSNNKRKEILKHNWVNIPVGFLASEVDLHRVIFSDVLAPTSSSSVNESFTTYLKNVVNEVGSNPYLANLDKEFAFHFITFLNRLGDILKTFNNHLDAQSELDEKQKIRQQKASLKSYLRLFRQLVNSNKIPFRGEPLKGLQVMGVLETRNLDFKNVFVLSLNEGAFPANSNKGSYIPYNIRKAYGLPTVEHQDSIYAYLFYRVLQRAENVFLFYNSETDVLGQGEMSRYLQQLIYESGLSFERKVLHNPIQPLDIHPLVIEKDQQVLQDLAKLNDGNAYFQGISPSALNTYIECRLKFYFRHVAKIKEPNEVEEELDARVLGNFLHDVMENFYKSIIERKKDKLIDVSDFDGSHTIIEKLIDKVFVKSYRLDPDSPVVYEGQRLVVKEIVKRFAHRILEMDKQYAPFTIEALEQGGLTYNVPIDFPPFKAVLSGKIDRIDRKANLLRIIDYKTGKDTLSFDNVDSLFLRDGKRNKAAFQTLLYALLYKKNSNLASHGDLKIVPGLINRLNLFDEEFSFGLKQGKDLITDVDILLPEFESGIAKIFNDLFDPKQPFDQTGDLENCRLCPYSQVCYR